MKKEGLLMKKKKDNGLRAVICLAVATVIVGGASIAISKLEHAGSVTLDVTGADAKIKEARQNADGTYTVVISEDGYVGEMIIEATYSADGQTLVSYDVTSSTETENIGTKVDEDAYKAVLAGVKLPVTASGLDISKILGLEQEAVGNAGTELKNGTYTARTEATETGDYNYVTITVENGKVTGVVWDEITGGASAFLTHGYNEYPSCFKKKRLPLHRSSLFFLYDFNHGCSLLHIAHLDEVFCNLHGVEGGTFLNLVAYNPEGEAVFVGQVLADTAYINRVFAC